jgi:hypothetical protein
VWCVRESVVPISRDNLFKIDDWIPCLNWDIRKVAPIEESAEMLRENPVALLIRCIDSRFAV